MRLPIRVILTVAMTLVALIPISVFSFWVTNSALEREFEAVEEKHLLIANNLTLALNRYAMDIKSAFISGTQAADLSRFGDEYRNLMQQLNMHSVMKVSADAQTINSLYGALQYSDHRSELKEIILFTQGSSSPTFIPVYKMGELEPNVFIVKEALNGDYWIAAISLEYIYTMQRSIAFGEKGHAAIVDQIGQVMAHPNPQWQSEVKNISKLSVIQKQMAGQTGVAEFYSPAMKADMIAGYSFVPQTGWGVMIPQPISELYENIHRVQYATIIIALISSLAAIVFSWLLSGVFSKPMRRLTQYAHQISQQKEALSIHFPDNLQSEETETLYLAMQKMSVEIYQNRHQLEKKVQERTAELSKTKDQSLYLANHDALTLLPNRLAIHQLIERLFQSKGNFAVLFLDLDGFKPLNDAHGHQFGDKVLQAVAARLTSVNKASDTVSRYGGDEFVIVLENIDSEKDALTTTERILSSVRLPYSIEHTNVHISASIGFALSAQANNVDEIIHLADKAMYSAKAGGKDQLVAHIDVGRLGT